MPPHPIGSETVRDVPRILVHLASLTPYAGRGPRRVTDAGSLSVTTVPTCATLWADASKESFLARSIDSPLASRLVNLVNVFAEQF
jgi:hypothetical protein